DRPATPGCLHDDFLSVRLPLNGLSLPAHCPLNPGDDTVTHSVIPAGLADEMIEIRHRIHAHPELGFEEFATSDLVAEQLQAWGYTVHRGLGGTGVVAQLKVGNGTQRLGLRADMDALPIHESTGLPYQSTIPG